MMFSSAVDLRKSRAEPLTKKEYQSQRWSGASDKVGDFDHATQAWIGCYNEVAIGSLQSHVFYLKQIETTVEKNEG